MGKSTAATNAAQELRQSGIPTAVLDLDEIYRMLRQQEGFGDSTTWEHTRHAAANLAAFALQRIAKVVIVEGSFHEEAELTDLIRGPNAAASLVLVSLCAPYDEVHKRVMNDSDPRRVASKVPAVLERLHADFMASLPFLRCRGHCLEVGNMSAIQVGREVANFALSEVRAGA